MSAVGRMEGTPPTLEWIGVDRLLIDERYQRATDTPTSRRIIFGMVKCWDWRLCQPLNVSRRVDGALYVVDGQHRLEGARERGDIVHLPCVVVSHRDRSDEADTFVALNVRRQKLSQGDIFNASLAAGDHEAQRVLEMVERAGLSFARSHTPAHWQPGQLFCGPALMKALRSFGEEVVSNALVALAEAYPATVMVRGATLLNALFLIYSDDARQRGFDPDLFIKAVGSCSQIEWIEFASENRQKNHDLSYREALALAFMEEHDTLRAEVA